MPKNLRGTAAQLNAFNNQQRLGVLGAGYALTAYKGLLQSVNTSVALVADADLVVQLAPGYWDVKLDANISIANAAHNIRYGFNAPDGLALYTDGSTLGRGFLGISGVAGQEDPITNVAITVTGGTTSAWTSLRVSFGLHVISGGSFQFMFAQNVSGASNTSILGGSRMVATYVANNLGV